ncbi:MAG: hypothetical protein Q4F17_07225 [Eubacteriales bacterium]|nr:hypothetical protein [Eubacteriales bacterium]
MFLIATVERTGPGRLVVRDRRTGQRVVVLARNSRCIFPGDLVSILYSGIMSRSRPPRITAIAIRRIFPSRLC